MFWPAGLPCIPGGKGPTSKAGACQNRLTMPSAFLSAVLQTFRGLSGISYLRGRKNKDLDEDLIVKK